MQRLIRVLMLLLAGLFALPASAEDPLKLGVLAFRSKAHTHTQWLPLAKYLETALERRVELTTYTFPELNDAVTQDKVDVVITNPGHFILLKFHKGLSAPLATLVTNEAGHHLSRYGSAIFAQADSSTVRSISDLAGKRIATTNKASLGSYQMAAFELLGAKVPLPDEANLVVTGMPHDLVVEAVLAGHADAGFVRSGVLEGMVREGKLDLGRIRIIHQQNPPDFPFITSTHLQPEWPVVVLPHVDEKTARLLAVALLSLSPESQAALTIGIDGFSIPADYSGVEAILRSLRLPPFDVAPEFTLTDLWNKHKIVISALGLLVLLLIGAGAALVVQNRHVKQARLRFVTLFEASPEPMWIIANGRFIDCNPAAVQLIGHANKDSLVGRSPAEVSPRQQSDGENSNVKTQRLLQAATTGMVQRFEWNYCKRDGGQFVANVTLAPSSLGEQAVILSVWHDITERKLAEHELQQSYSALKELNDKVVATQNQLLQSEKMAAIGQLAAGVAHEINNPIGFVNSNLGTLQNYVASLLGLIDDYERYWTESNPHLEQIATARQAIDFDFLRTDILALLSESHDGLARVKKIVQDLKDFSHIDEAEWQDANINAGIESTLNVVWNEIKYKAEVVRNYGELPLVRCIPGQLNQVFLNLLINATQAIDAHGTITVRTGTEDDRVWIEVNDTGSGIPPDVQKRIFEPFFTTKPVGKGTGLGLSLAYDIVVKKHRGHFEVESEPGRGTTFRIWLPTFKTGCVDTSIQQSV